jgi:hypothetical protein
MTKCINCKKKTILLEECKCKKVLCFTCLPFFVHDCAFNHKEEKKKLLTEQLQKITADKIIKI